MGKSRARRQRHGSSLGRGRERRRWRGLAGLGRATATAATRWGRHVWALVRPGVVRNWATLRVWGIFAATVLGFLLTLPLYESLFTRFLPPLFAGWAGVVLSALGTGVQVSGSLVSSSRFSFEVAAACSGIYPAIVFISAVVAYPCRFGEKLVGILLGVPALAVVNVVRLVTLFYVGTYLPSLFELGHLIFWQALMIIVAVFLWLVWAQRFTHAVRH